MATLDLSSFSYLGTKTSVIGYSTKTDGYTSGLTSNSSIEDKFVVGELDNSSGHKFTLRGKDDAKVKDVTEVNVGSSSDNWTIVGANEADAHVKTIKTGAGKDSVGMAFINDGANINVGAGDDSVSVGTALGTMTLELGDGADSVQVSTATGALTVNAGSGANEVSIGKADSTFNYNGGEDADVVSLESVAKSADITLGNGANQVKVTKADSDLTISAGDGHDIVNVVTAEGNVVVNVGDGNNQVSVAKAGGTLQVSAGSGKDSISIGNVGKDATIALGDGADSLVVGNTNADKVEGLLTITADGEAANLVSVQSGSIDKGVAINMGSGADSVIIKNATVGGSINLGDGKDEVSIKAIEKATITGGSGNKIVSLGSVVNGSITLGAGKDSVSIAGKVEDSTVDLGDGRDFLYLASSATGTTFNAGAENDIVSVNAALKETTINLGEGNDTITIVGSKKMADVSISGGAGKDVFSLGSGFDGTVTITDFEVGTDTLYGGAFNSSIFGSDGAVSLGSNAKAQMTATNGYYAVTYADGGDARNVAWAGESAASIDISSFNKSAVLIGNNNDDTSDTLLGGTKDDSIFAGANDYVYGGKGNDSIYLKAGDKETTYVGFTAEGGKDVVTGFGSDDVVYLFQNSVSDISKVTATSATNATLKMGTATLTVDGTQFKVRDNSGSDYKVQIVSTSISGSGTVEKVDDMADIYYSADGSTSVLNFSKVNDKLVVDLGNTGIVTNTNNAQYLGKFASVKGGSDDTILVGAAGQSESLEAGTGAATLWGGGSKTDVMIHNGSDNSVMFVFGQNDGKDTIVSKNWGGSDSNDVLWLSGGSVSSIKNDGTDTTVALASGDKVTLKGQTDANTIIKYTTDGGATTSKIKVGKSGQANNFNYTDEVSAFVGGSGNTLTVGSDVDTANIWLDGSKGQSYDSVKVVDAHTSAGDIVIAGVGNNNESLVAAKGSSSLWGGAGSSNDTLAGTTGGTTTYFWGNGDGKDVITGSHSDDLVNLYNVALSDIAQDGLKTTSTSMVITLNDGSALTINNMSSSSVKTFQLSDGSKWEYSTSTKEWSQA